MKNFHFSRHCALPLMVWATLMFWVGTSALFAAEPDGQPKNEPIEITSDRMVSDSTKHNAEFSGNVTVIQGDTRIDCDRMVLYFGENGSQPGASAMQDIQKIEFIGQVRIHMDNRLAVSDQAVYTTSNRILRLTGPSSKITDGPDEISGGEIIFDRSSEEVTITKGDQSGQVKAVLRSDQRGLN